LLPLIARDGAEAVRLATERLDRFNSHFERAHLDVTRNKLGLFQQEEHDGSLGEGLLAIMAEQRADYTLCFRRLGAAAEPSSESAFTSLFDRNERPIRGWLQAWRKRLALEAGSTETRNAALRRANPAFIPRNHRVEEAIRAAVGGDFEPFERLVHVLATPHDEQPEHSLLAEPPSPEQCVHETFCGT
jgi:uncharacterized protein YdiU (UPF0061 family)